MSLSNYQSYRILCFHFFLQTTQSNELVYSSFISVLNLLKNVNALNINFQLIIMLKHSYRIMITFDIRYKNNKTKSACFSFAE